ncbi:hypothetical protein MASR2M78_32510 [Treponema sp.]
MKMGRLLAFSLILFLAVFHLVAEEAYPYYLTLEQGKRLYRNAEYGDALLAFEDALRQRKEKFEKLEQAFIQLLSLDEVRRLGDSLSRIEAYITERKQFEAAKALKELYELKPKDSFNDSASRALAMLAKLKVYPEARYWIGEVYRAEGEYGIALKQYAQAYEQKDFLDSPEEGRILLYKMAELHESRREYNEMERALLSLIEYDELWAQDSKSFVRQSMTRTLSNEGINRFLSLYRYDSVWSSQAHRLLGFYYYSTGRHQRALDHLSFAFLIQSTAIIDELKRRDFDWKFTDLTELLRNSQKRTELERYIKDSEYYKTSYYLGATLFAVGKRSPAMEIWRTLASTGSAGEWRGRSERQLAKPYVEEPSQSP